MANNQQDGFFFQGPAAQSALNTDILSGVVNGSYDVSSWGYASVQIVGSVGIASGNVSFECSNDNVNFQLMVVSETTLTSGVLTSAAFAVAASTSKVYFFPVISKFIRVRISTVFAGGTIQAFMSLRQTSPIPTFMPVRSSVPSQVLVTATPTVGTMHTLPSAAASTNATSVKVTGAQLMALTLTNLSATVKYFKLYNKASAPTVGTDIPIATIPVAATSVVVYEFGALGQLLNTGLAYALTALMTDADATALVAGDMKVALTYI